jgi:hypothetical protein
VFYRDIDKCDDENLDRPQSRELIQWFNNNKVDGKISFNSTGYNDDGWATTIVRFNNSEDAAFFMLVFG